MENLVVMSPELQDVIDVGSLVRAACGFHAKRNNILQQISSAHNSSNFVSGLDFF